MNNEIEEMLEPVPEEQMIEWPGHPIAIPGEWPAYMLSPDTLRFWCMFDEDGIPHPLSCLVNLAHPAASAVEDSMLAWVIDPRTRTDVVREDFCLRLGLSPLQPFQIELYAHYSTDYWGETDLDTHWEIVQVRPMPARDVLENLLSLPFGPWFRL